MDEPRTPDRGTSQKSSHETALRDGICNWIGTTLAPSKALYACGNGSSASVNLGSSAPSVTVQSVELVRSSRSLATYKVKFKGNFSSTDASVRVSVKCKGETLGVTVDEICPDPRAEAKVVNATLATSEMTLNVNHTSREVHVLSTVAGDVDTTLGLKLCFKFVVAGKTCWSLGDDLDGLFDKEINRYFKRAVDSLGS